VCGSCDLARLYLEKRKVPFTEKNLDNNPETQQELKKKSGSLSAPTITIGEKVMNGYLESLLEGELDAAGYPKIGGAAPTGDDDKNAQDTAVPDEADESAKP
jgi:glutaredoxin